PGMVHTAILGRKLDWPVINLGFSGNGKMEPELARLAPEQRWARALAELKGAGLVRPDTGPRELERVFQMFQMNQRTIAEILRHYYPRRYDGPLTVIHAAEADRLSADPSLGWQPLCSRPVEMVETPGDHGTIFSRHFRELGERLLKAVATGRQAQAGKARGPAGRPVDLAGFGRGR
ncbi:MAG TPA: SGNH/GDSL hydrolase family protein, partial [Thermoanaerobaculia bacterium]|nr:SGNH/GDSL hydrolase family protein [Thermoanaerobaculia bacterium]